MSEGGEVMTTVLAEVVGKKTIAKRVRYSEKVTDIICERIARGESMNSICKDVDMPDMSSVLRWVHRYEEFAVKSARARQLQATVWMDSMMDVACTEPRLHPITGAIDSADVTHINNKVRTMQFLASKLNSKAYGDKTIHAGDAENPIATIIRGADADL